MGMDQIKFFTSLLQPQEQCQKNIGLLKKTRIHRAPQLLQGKTGRQHTFRYGYWLNMYARHVRTGTSKQRYFVPPSNQSLRQARYDRLRTSHKRLGYRCD